MDSRMRAHKHSSIEFGHRRRSSQVGIVQGPRVPPMILTAYLTATEARDLAARLTAEAGEAG